MIKFSYLVCIVSLGLISLSSKAQLNSSKIAQKETQLKTAIISEPISIQIGENLLRSIPIGTRISFSPSNDLKNINIRSLIITDKIPNQKWKLQSGKEIIINCGHMNSSPAFLTINRASSVISGCHSIGEHEIISPRGIVTVMHESQLDFFNDSTLLASTKTRGAIQLTNVQSIELLSESHLRFYPNRKLHYLFAKPEQTFYQPTQLSSRTSFITSNENYPIMFYESGQIQTAILSLEEEKIVSINAFGTEVQIPILKEPIGFDENGQINQLLLKKRQKIEVTKKTFITRAERRTGAVVKGSISPGSQVVIQEGTQLFLQFQNNQLLLDHYPEQGPMGLEFMYLLRY